MEKKTLFMLCGSVIAFLLILLFGVLLLSIFNPKYYTYEQAEQLIKEATEEYYQLNPAGLPVDDGKYNLSYEALVQAELIKPLNEVLEDGDTCSASITIVKQESIYSYIPILNCGDAYTTRSLVDKILADNQVVTQDSGLYQDNGEYYFKGKVSNNYVAFGSYEKKNKDYGDSFHISFEEEGMAMVRIRLGDKLNRFKALSRGNEQMVKDESIRDTLMDLANYTLMAVLEMEVATDDDSE